MQLQAGVGFFRPKTTHPLACNCETGWVSCSFSLRQRTTTSHVGSSSSSASVCTHHDDDDNPPPRLQLRDGVGFLFLFFKVTNMARRRHLPPSAPTTTTTITHPLACNCETGWVSCSFSLRQRTTTSHVGSSSSSASVCTHHDNDKPCRLVVVAPVLGCLACERGALYKCIIN